MEGNSKVNNNAIVSKEFGEMTINQLMNQDDVEIKKKNNKIMIKKVTPRESISVEIRTYETDVTILQAQVNSPYRKKDLKCLVKQMKSEGKTQTEIAGLLGTSQPYISKLLNSD